MIWFQGLFWISEVLRALVPPPHNPTPAQVTDPWFISRKIQTDIWIKMDRDVDVNVVVKMLEEKAK